MSKKPRLIPSIYNQLYPPTRDRDLSRKRGEANKKNSRQMGLNFDFPPHLFLDFVLDDFFLEQTLQRNDVFRFRFGPSHVNPPKLSFS